MKSLRNDVTVEYYPTSRKYGQQATHSLFQLSWLSVYKLTFCNNTETRTVPSEPIGTESRPAWRDHYLFATCSAPDPQTLARLDDDDLEL